MTRKQDVKPASNFKQAIGKIADAINETRRNELIKSFTNKDGFLEAIKKLKRRPNAAKAKGKARWRLHASMPAIVDDFFEAMYGKEYYKDRDFFKKHYPEWLAFDPREN
jgi:hypothetical protein